MKEGVTTRINTLETVRGRAKQERRDPDARKGDEEADCRNTNSENFDFSDEKKIQEPVA